MLIRAFLVPSPGSFADKNARVDWTSICIFIHPPAEVRLHNHSIIQIFRCLVWTLVFDRNSERLTIYRISHTFRFVDRRVFVCVCSRSSSLKTHWTVQLPLPFMFAFLACVRNCILSTINSSLSTLSDIPWSAYRYRYRVFCWQFSIAPKYKINTGIQLNGKLYAKYRMYNHRMLYITLAHNHRDTNRSEDSEHMADIESRYLFDIYSTTSVDTEP